MVTSEQTPPKEDRKDFFISYTSADRAWAEWIAWQLEEMGYRIVLQAWDFHAGDNFVLDMDSATKQAERTIAVLSTEYFASTFTPSEWAAAFGRDPKGEQGLLIPVRVRPCDVEGLLGQIVYVDLADRTEQEAQAVLLAEVQRRRRKPPHAPTFPFHPSIPKPDRFPGAPQSLPGHRFSKAFSSERSQKHTKESPFLGLRIILVVLLALSFGFSALIIIQSQSNLNQAKSNPNQDALLATYEEKISSLAPDQKEEQAACIQPSIKTKALLQTTVDSDLKQLDTSHKSSLPRFLYNLCLISGAPKVDPIVVLNGDNLSNVDFTHMPLYIFYLVGTNLQGADFQGALLNGSDLRGANLRGAHHLTRDQLSKAWRLSGAILPDGTTCPAGTDLNDNIQYSIKQDCLQHDHFLEP